ncbi:universal stress protein [Streptomyces toyocaensis]|uniref:Universal stress protein n=1 Tax=Streptomyces toyocaensis TaxID=55952 RepID=A0A081XZZ2_STRTO|nr:universal stress protein [Streptomyces toyocaensis]KES09115.1 universal stress protein [Streptomyces toyocaensis]
MAPLPLVVGVDGSEPALLAVDWAVDEAARHHLALRLVHASPWAAHESAVPPSGGPPSARAAAGRVLAAAAGRAHRRDPRIEVSTAVLAEEAARALLNEAGDAAFLVLGSRGRGPLRGLLLGSVGLTVAARAHCPVIVVRGDPAGLAGGHGRILLGAGDPGTSGEAVRFAFREAEARGCALDAVRAWRCPAYESLDHPATTGAPERRYEERASALLDAVLREAVAAHPGVRVRRATVEGPASKVLVLRSAAADLAVVGARRHRGHAGLQLGRAAHTLLHHAQCPVAVVPEVPRPA